MIVNITDKMARAVMASRVGAYVTGKINSGLLKTYHELGGVSRDFSTHLPLADVMARGEPEVPRARYTPLMTVTVEREYESEGERP